MKKILRIGEFSQINQISIQTLRFYDQIGLLKPYKVDPENNYRYYHINQSSLVDSIQYLRQLNFSLEDIKEILSDKDHFQLHQLIEERYQRLLEEKGEFRKTNPRNRNLSVWCPYLWRKTERARTRNPNFS